MAEIKSGATADKWTIDPTSKAGRVTLYRSDGSEIWPKPNGAYLLPVGFRMTAALAANSLVWAMRNGSSRTIVIKRVTLLVGFDGTAAASVSIYNLLRFTGANPTGGNALTVVKRDSTDPASTVQDSRESTGGAALTDAGISYESPFARVGCQRQVNANNQLNLIPLNLEREGLFILGSNEGLGIRLVNAAVIGDHILGGVSWDER